MGRLTRRGIICGCFAAGASAGTFAVMSALSGPVDAVSAAQATATSRTVSFEHGGAVTVRTLPDGRTCYAVGDDVGGAHGCLRLNAVRIGFAVAPRSVGGVAGANVRAVIVKLTRKGTVWATIDHGAFYAPVPPDYRPRIVIKVLKDGSRRAFSVTATR